MFTFYLVSLLVGAGFFAVSLALGAEHDFFHHHGGDFGHGHGHSDGSGDDGPSITNLRVIMAFLAAFGAAGLIATYYGLRPVPSVLSASGGGFALGALVFYLLKQVYRQQASSHVSTGGVVGRVGWLAIGIEGTPGEVVVSLPQGNQTYVARTESGETIAAGRQVRIKEIQGETAIVERA